MATNPADLGRAQVEVAEEWTELYTSGKPELGADPLTSIEITLRNPAVYARNLDSRLSPALLEEWNKLFDFIRGVAGLVSLEAIDPEAMGSPLDYMQSLLFRGQVNPAYRRTVADIIDAASRLFEQSISSLPPHRDAQYLSGNVLAAKGWLKTAKRQYNLE
ncbi:MAG: hypothetical protein WC777_01560 [Candidatus Gracilibacteria bacterium]